MLALLVLSALLSSNDSISVDRHAPTTQFVSFDPAHPPADVEKLHHGENALTRMLFNCTVKLKYNTIEKSESHGHRHVLTHLDEVKVTLELTNTIYLPVNVTSKLKSHELGHARINAMIYEDAERAARVAAQDAMTREWSGNGADPDTAGKAATDAAVDAICHEYLHMTADKAFRIGEIYDDLTKHGTNAKQEDDAIREATQKWESERR
jgi:hypothetical protein